MRRGFSLLELVLAIGLMGVLLALGMGLSRRPAQQGEARSLAEKVAGELRTAREEAVARQVPVGVGLQSHSLYRAAGEVARLESSRDFGREYPQACLWWEGAGAAPAWAVGLPAGPLVVFAPDGQASTTLAGARLAVCTGVTPSEIFSPYTVAVSPRGEVSVTAGWTGLAARAGEGPLPPSGPVPVVTAPAAGDPTFVKVEAFPAPNPATLPAGVDNTVRADGFLTFSVEARDPQGDPLTLEWSCAQGGQCSPMPVSMRYDAGVWKSTWEWRPPAGTAPGTRFELTCKVRDDQGHEADSALVGAVGRVEVLPPGRLIFALAPGEIWSANPDGSDLQLLASADGAMASPDGSLVALRASTGVVNVTNRDGSEPLECFAGGTSGAGCEHLAWHPHGNLLLIQTSNLGPEPDEDWPGMMWRRRALYLVRPNGDNPVTGVAGVPMRLFEFNDESGGKLSWHPSGTKFAYTRERGIWVGCLDSSLHVGANSSLGPNLHSALFSPDGNWLAVLDASGHLFVVPYVSTGPTDPGSLGPAAGWIPVPAAGAVTSMSWSPDGSRLVFLAGGDIFECLADGTGPRSLVAGRSCSDISWGW